MTVAFKGVIRQGIHYVHHEVGVHAVSYAVVIGVGVEWVGADDVDLNSVSAVVAVRVGAEGIRSQRDLLSVQQPLVVCVRVDAEVERGDRGYRRDARKRARRL